MLRRVFALIVLVLAGAASAAAADLSVLEARFQKIIRASRSEIGVALIHLESGQRLSINGANRFPMASVYKLPIAVELLLQVAQGQLTLDRPVAIGPSDIRACCTLSRRHPKGGVTLPARALLEMMIIESDNTAADAVLKLVGGPEAVERRLRALRFTAINVNRDEGAIAFERDGVRHPPPRAEWTLELYYKLVAAVSRQDLAEARLRYMRDPRDSATPDDMALYLARLQRGELLPRPFTDLLLDLMARATTGPARLKGLLPIGATVAHKTGTTAVVINDVGIITLPEGSGHLVMAVFVMNGPRPSVMQHAIAQLAGAAWESFTGKPLPPRPKPPKRVRRKPARPRRR